jgi:hypothetical protein
MISLAFADSPCYAATQMFAGVAIGHRAIPSVQARPADHIHNKETANVHCNYTEF